MRIALKTQREKGFSLIVVAVVTMLLGICLQYGVGFFKTETETERELATERKVQRVTAQIASFTQQYYRLPCPASPAAGNPTQVTFGFEDTPNPETTTSCNRTEGIIPYRTLGIEPTEATDAWGRYMTYAISPVFADTSSDPTNVHFRCRTENWHDTLNNVNYNVLKARYCCPNGNTYAASTDIQIVGEPALVRDTLPASMNNANIEPPNTTLATESPDAWAMVLISHGRNGHGAFLGNGTLTKHTIANFGAPEGENADGDNVFQTAQRNYVLGPNYFDDIMTYQTQSQLYAILSSGTCIMP